MQLKKINFEKLDCSAVYVHPSVLSSKIKAHYKRPIVKVICLKSKKSILRKLRAKSKHGLTADILGIDYISLLELHASEGDQVEFNNAKFWSRYVTYYRKHPDEEIRLAWLYFTLSFFMGFVSLILTIYSMLNN